MYLTGRTNATDFPTTVGAYDTSSNGGYDAFVTKLTAAGALAYSTFLGGSREDYSWGIAVDGSGNSYVTGQTTSSNFPTTAGAYDISHNGNFDAFVTRLNASGGLSYSTFLGSVPGGGETGRDIAVDSGGNIYVVGYTNSSAFPTTAGAYDTTQNGDYDVFVAKLTAAGALSYSTFLGGTGVDFGLGLARDSSNNIYVTGST